MNTHERKPLTFLSALSLLISGVCVGWLIGLSYTPVMQVVITSIITLVVSITSALAGIRFDQNEHQTSDEAKPKHRRSQFQLNPYPVMLMIIGLALGASGGIY